MRLPHVRPWLPLGLYALLANWTSPLGLAASSDPFAFEPFPAVIAAAKEQQIPLQGVNFGPGGSESRIGDMIVALVSLSEKDHERQWLIQLTAAPLNRNDRAALDLAKDKLALRLFSSCGTEVRFNAGIQAIEARTLGPFYGEVPQRAAPTTKPSDRRAHALILGGFLGLGLDRFATSVQKLKQTPGMTKLDWKLAQTPFPAEVISQNQALAHQLGFEPEDERSVVGGPLAIRAFFDTVQNTPGLQEIMAELLDKSSLAWSMLTHGGQLKPNFKPDVARIALLPSLPWSTEFAPAYRCPLTVTINEKPFLLSELLVTAPRPPLLNCGGIVGMSVEPSGDQSKHLVIRVLAAKRGDPEISP